MESAAETEERIRQLFPCWYCGGIDEPRETDHMIPVSKGGSFLNDNENCVYACRPCNSSKSAMSVQQFREKIARLLGLDDWKAVRRQASVFPRCFVAMVHCGQHLAVGRTDDLGRHVPSR